MTDHYAQAETLLDQSSPKDPLGAAVAHALLAVHDLFAGPLDKPTEAVLRALRREALAEILTDMEDKHGPVDEDEVDYTLNDWRELAETRDTLAEDWRERALAAEAEVSRVKAHTATDRVAQNDPGEAPEPCCGGCEDCACGPRRDDALLIESLEAIQEHERGRRTFAEGKWTEQLNRAEKAEREHYEARRQRDALGLLVRARDRRWDEQQERIRELRDHERLAGLPSTADKFTSLLEDEGGPS